MFHRSERLFLRPAWPEDETRLSGSPLWEARLRLCERVDDVIAQAATSLWQTCWERRAGYLPLLVTRPELANAPAIGFAVLVHDHGHCEISIWIDPSLRRQGYGKETVQALLSIATMLGQKSMHIAQPVTDEIGAGLTNAVRGHKVISGRRGARGEDLTFQVTSVSGRDMVCHTGQMPHAA
ncbi:MAG: GNAT family N-acetyltransferase [Sphingomonadaceae bacterium]